MTLRGRFAAVLALAVYAIGGATVSAAPEPSGEKIVLAFMGDSMVDGLWGGVTRLVSKQDCLSSKVKLLRFGKNGTGLTRPAKFDWISEAQSITQAQKPTLTVISLGLNDRQSIVDRQRKRYDLGTPEWRAKYAELAASFAKAASSAPAGVVWVGIPVLRDQVSQKDAAEKNAIVAEAIAAMKDPKVRYLEPWHAGTATAADKFEPYGPDVGGSLVQLRSPDGIHFTSAGYDVVAKYLFPKIVEQLRAHNVELGPSCGT